MVEAVSAAAVFEEVVSAAEDLPDIEVVQAEGLLAGLVLQGPLRAPEALIDMVITILVVDIRDIGTGLGIEDGGIPLTGRDIGGVRFIILQLIWEEASLLRLF